MQEPQQCMITHKTNWRKFRPRNNSDHESDSPGLTVIDICKAFNLMILNGRKADGLYGKHTFF